MINNHHAIHKPHDHLAILKPHDKAELFNQYFISVFFNSDFGLYHKGTFHTTMFPLHFILLRRDSTWKLRNWTHFWDVITFPPLFCTYTFDTSLLLIVCALRWCVKCLYRHLFLSKHARSLKKWHFLICGKHNSKAPWSYVCHKLGSAIVLVALACLDISSKKMCQWRFFTYHNKQQVGIKSVCTE